MPIDEIKRVVFAMNGPSTNFVRMNGFVIIDGALIRKPLSTIPLIGDGHIPLQGSIYEAFVLQPEPRIERIEITGQGEKEYRTLSGKAVSLAISGPIIVEERVNKADQIRVRFNTEGQTIGNEVNFVPHTDYLDFDGNAQHVSPNHPLLYSSYSTIGCDESGNLILLSVFGGSLRIVSQAVHWIVRNAVRDGVSVYQLAQQMIKLGAKDAVLLGGSGDTQCYVKDEVIRMAQINLHHNTPILRGLGAILAIFDLQ